MRTKTIKTPLMMAEAFGLTSCSSSLALESELSRRPEVQYSLTFKLSHHGGKNTALRAKKPVDTRLHHLNAQLFFSEAMFLPRMMFPVAKQRVVMAGLMQELALKHKAMISTRKLEERKHLQRSYLGFC